MKTTGHYLAVFLSSRANPSWQAWNALSEPERRARKETGLAALRAWDEAHRDAIVYAGGPLGPNMRVTSEGVCEAANDLTLFVVVRAASHEEAARLFEGHPHMTIFPCDAVEVMPLLGGPPEA